MISKWVVRADDNDLSQHPIQDFLEQINYELIDSNAFIVTNHDNDNHLITFIERQSNIKLKFHPPDCLSYKTNEHPEVLYITSPKPFATNLNASSSVVVFDGTGIAHNHISFENNNTAKIYLKSGVGIIGSGSHLLYNNELRLLDSSIPVFNWLSFVSEDFNYGNQVNCESKRTGRYRLLRLKDDFNTNINEYVGRQGLTVVKEYHIKSNSFTNKGYIYLLCQDLYSFDINKSYPSDGDIVTNSSFKIRFTIDVPNTIQDSGLKVYVTDSHGNSYYECTPISITKNVITATVPASGLTNGVHHIKFIGSGLYFFNGKRFGGNNPYRYFSYYKTNNLLENIINVTGTATIGQVLTYDGGGNWYPSTVSISTGGSGGVSTGSMWDLGYITEAASSIFDFGSLS